MSTDKRVTVLQLTQYLGGGGLERVVATLCTNLDRSRFRPMVMCLRAGGDLVPMVEGQGIPVFVAQRDPARRDLGIFRQIRSVVRREGVDIIHSHNTEPFVQGVLAAGPASGVRVVHTDHARDFPDRFIWHLAEHMASWRAHRVVGVSDHTTRELGWYPRIGRGKLVTIPNGIDGEAFTENQDRALAKRRLGLDPSRVVVGLAVARFTPQKGLDVLLDAFETVVAAHPEACLAIAGDADGRAEMETSVRARGLGEAVRFLGRRSDMVNVLAAFDLYALSSRWEGLPMAVLEAMAAALPVVATRVGGVPTAVRHGVTGLLVPAEDPSSLARALGLLLGAPGLRAAFGEAGRRRYHERFTAAAMTRAYERLYVGGAG